MIPLTGHVNELKYIQPRLIEIAKQVMEEKKVDFHYKFGTMIEIPRAALTAGEIAEVAEFFSFGTNDLTQMTFGYSRESSSGNLDHCAKFVMEVHFLFFHHLLGDLDQAWLNIFQFVHMTSQRDHDFWFHVNTL